MFFDDEGKIQQDFDVRHDYPFLRHLNLTFKNAKPNLRSNMK